MTGKLNCSWVGIALENILWLKYEGVTAFLRFRNRVEPCKFAQKMSITFTIVENYHFGYFRETNLMWVICSSFTPIGKNSKLPVLSLNFLICQNYTLRGAGGVGSWEKHNLTPSTYHCKHNSGILNNIIICIESMCAHYRQKTMHCHAWWR